MMVHGRKYRVYLILLVSITLLLTPTLYAQDATAKILGQVVDPSGAVLPNAVITVTNVDTNSETPAKTDKDGAYQVNQLPIGSYKISATSEGFARATSSTYKLQINQSQRVDFKLAIAGNVQSIDCHHPGTYHRLSQLHRRRLRH